MYSSIEDFNELTLNLMTNKVYYNEYLEKTNPIKFNELQEYKRKFNKYCCDDSTLLTSFTAFCNSSFVQFTMIEGNDRNKTKDKKSFFSVI